MSTTAQALTGKVALITGANTGIGLVTARELAAQGATVFIACRSAERAQRASDEIRRATGKVATFLALDLGDLDSVRRCAREFLATGLPLHLLINNAGLAGKKGLTPSGFELSFGVCHVGHFLLTELLLERLKQSAPARVITVASRAHYRTKGIDFGALRRPAGGLGIRAYQVAKLANVLFSAELGRLLEGSGVTTYSLHPGVVETEIWREAPRVLLPLLKLRGLLTPEEGAKTTLYCATAPELASQSGLYYSECQAKAPSAAAQDRALAKELWQRSLAWVHA